MLILYPGTYAPPLQGSQPRAQGQQQPQQRQQGQQQQRGAGFRDNNRYTPGGRSTHVAEHVEEPAEEAADGESGQAPTEESVQDTAEEDEQELDHHQEEGEADVDGLLDTLNDILSVTTNRLKSITQARGFTKPANKKQQQAKPRSGTSAADITARKARSNCSVCNEKGHWAGDPECKGAPDGRPVKEVTNPAPTTQPCRAVSSVSHLPPAADHPVAIADTMLNPDPLEVPTRSTQISARKRSFFHRDGQPHPHGILRGRYTYPGEHSGLLWRQVRSHGHRM